MQVKPKSIFLETKLNPRLYFNFDLHRLLPCHPSFIAFALFLLIPNFSWSQNTPVTEYYNREWQRCPQGQHTFYRVIQYDEHGKSVGPIRNYTKNGVLQWEGQLSSFTPHQAMDGKCTWYYPSGHKQESITYSKGIKEGEYTAWYESGELKCRLNYIHNLREGLYTCYHKAGTKAFEGSYINNSLEGEYHEWYNNGTLRNTGTFFHGKKNGKHTSYFDNGKLRESANYEKDTLVGDYLCLYKNGSVRQKCRYIHNRTDTTQLILTYNMYNKLSRKERYWQYTAINSESKEPEQNTATMDISWYPNGKVKIFNTDSPESLNGKTFEWDKYGSRIYNYNFRDSLRSAYRPVFRQPLLHKYKDNIACLYGLKDSNDRKICAPKYQLVEDFFSNEAVVEASDGLFGAIDTFGREIVKPKYNALERFISGFEPGEGPYMVESKDTNDLATCFRTVLNGKTGIINYRGRTIARPEYDVINEGGEDYYYPIKSGLMGFGDIRGVEVEPMYDSLDYIGGIYFKAGMNINGKNKALYGLINSRGKRIVPMEYDDFYYNARIPGIIVGRKNNRLFFLDTNGNFILPKDDYIANFDKFYPWEIMDPHLLVLNINGKFGILDSLGKWVVKPQYDSIWQMAKNGAFGTEKYTDLALFKKNGKCGLLCNTGLIKIQGKFEDLDYTDDLMSVEENSFGTVIFIAKLNGKYGVVDENDSILLPFEYSRIRSWNNGLSLEKDGFESEFEFENRTKIINYQGKFLNDGQPVIHNLSYKSIWGMDEDKSMGYNSPTRYKYSYILSNGGKMGVLNQELQLILDTVYDAVFNFNQSDDGFWVMKERLDESGKKDHVKIDSLASLPYAVSYQVRDKIDFFKLFYQHGRWAYVNIKGKPITDTLFEFPSVFNGALARVTLNGKPYLMKKNGVVIKGQDFDSIMYDGHKFFYFVKGKTKGLVDSNGNICASGNWDKYFGFIGQYALYFENGKPGIIDSTGKILFSAGKNEIANKSIDLKAYFNINWSLEYDHEPDRYMHSSPGKSFRRNPAIFDSVKDEHMKIIAGNTEMIFSFLGQYGYYAHELKSNNVLFRNYLFYSRINALVDNTSVSSLYYLSFGYNSGHYCFAKTESVVKNIFGLSVIHDYDGYRKGEKGNSWEYYNYLVEGKNLRQLYLKDLFDSTKDYAGRLKKLFPIYIKKLEDQELDCNRTGEYFETARDHFIIKEKGISFYLTAENELLIPYSELKDIINTNGPLKGFY